MNNRVHLYTGSVPIRWTDVDPYGMLNHAVYFTLMEEIRWQWFQSLKLDKKIEYIFCIAFNSDFIMKLSPKIR